MRSGKGRRREGREGEKGECERGGEREEDEYPRTFETKVPPLVTDTQFAQRRVLQLLQCTLYFY